MRSRQSTTDFLAQIEAASRSPLGWAILPGTRTRPAARVTVLCEEDAGRVWVRYRGQGVNIELVARDELSYFRPYGKEPHGNGAPLTG